MQTAEPHLRRRLIDPDLVLRTIAEGTAATVGEGFFRALVQNLARALDPRRLGHRIPARTPDPPRPGVLDGRAMARRLRDGC